MKYFDLSVKKGNGNKTVTVSKTIENYGGRENVVESCTVSTDDGSISVPVNITLLGKERYYLQAAGVLTSIDSSLNEDSFEQIGEADGVTYNKVSVGFSLGYRAFKFPIKLNTKCISIKGSTHTQLYVSMNNRYINTDGTESVNPINIYTGTQQTINVVGDPGKNDVYDAFVIVTYPEITEETTDELIITGSDNTENNIIMKLSIDRKDSYDKNAVILVNAYWGNSNNMETKTDVTNLDARKISLNNYQIEDFIANEDNTAYLGRRIDIAFKSIVYGLTFSDSSTGIPSTFKIARGKYQIVNGMNRFTFTDTYTDIQLGKRIKLLQDNGMNALSIVYNVKEPNQKRVPNVFKLQTYTDLDCTTLGDEVNITFPLDGGA